MNRDKELYKQLRALRWDQLWHREIPRFNAASPRERLERVAVIRAVAVVFSESGPPDQLPDLKTWLHSLLNDPEEKIRRYAIAALPKLGRDELDEKQLLGLSQKSVSDREKNHLAKALGKIGGSETLRHATSLPPQTIQRVQAKVARAETPSAINLNAPLANFQTIEILLHCRAGLEAILRHETESFIRFHKKFRLTETKTALVILKPIAPFTLADIYKLRCFSALSFSIKTHQHHRPGTARLRPSPFTPKPSDNLTSLANTITSQPALSILQALTTGPIRYRLDFANKGHQRAAVRELAQLIHTRNPGLINGGGDTPWTIQIHSTSRSHRIELVPKILPDPRFTYRRRDIPAASHPPLAAAMARLSFFQDFPHLTEANKGNKGADRKSSSFPSFASVKSSSLNHEIVWDPFCGSGLELIERSLLGGVQKIIGTDLSPEALQTAQQNFAAAKIQNIETQFICCDFRNFNPGPGQIALIITNPPMGKRVPIPNLRQLIDDLLQTAAGILAPGGRLVFANPFKNSASPPSLHRDFSQQIDFGGFHCWLERYLKS